jgi:hypothetical protein
MDWSRVFEIALTVVLVPSIAWMLKTLVEIKTVLVGTDGQNGIKSDVRRLRDQVDDHEHRLTVAEGKIIP